jgi:hypothetical protein
MLSPHKTPPIPFTAAEWKGEISTRTLLYALADHREKMLTFTYDDRAIQAGYHVTEVKSGRFDALDCGANPESWTETFIQLWDIPAEPGRISMTVSKFLAIMEKVIEEVPFDLDGKLTFEVSDPGSAIRLFGVTGIDTDGRVVRVSLRSRPASCKPRDRWLQNERTTRACCA